MKTYIFNKNNIVSALIMFSFAFLILTSIPAMATDFEFGTQFGISHIIASDDYDTTSFTFTQIPGGLISGFSLPSLYATWFPNENFGIGPEFSFSNFSFDEDSNISTLYLGGRASYLLNGYSGSTPYISGRFSLYTISLGELIFSDDETGILANIGIGFGYQWRIGPAFVLRTEAHYQRILPFEDEPVAGNEFSLIIGIGTRFGNNKTGISEVLNAQ